jgi:hypothetical protein
LSPHHLCHHSIEAIFAASSGSVNEYPHGLFQPSRLYQYIPLDLQPMYQERVFRLMNRRLQIQTKKREHKKNNEVQSEAKRFKGDNNLALN